MKSLLAILALSGSCFAQLWSGVLAPARAADWTQAGAPGGVPVRSVICANVLTTDNTSQIQTKITNCPVNQVVKFPAGTWNLSGNLCSLKGIVLRGVGPTTILHLSGGDIYFSVAGCGGLGSYPPNLGSTNWTGGLTRGSTVLTVASTAGVLAGQHVVLDQRNAAYVFTTGIEGACTSGNSCGRNDTPLQFNGASSRAQEEIVEIQTVDSATQITIKAPGISHDYTIGLVPQVFYWNTAGAQGPGNIKFAGVEDMKIDANGNNYAVSMPFCDECWVKNVSVINMARSGVFFWWGYKDEMRDSFLSASNSPGGPTEYGVEALQTTFTKIENNICFGVTACILPEGTYGLVVAHNHTLNTATGSQFASFSAHLSHNFGMLYEDNSTPEIAFDNSWGSASQSTLFRNALSGHSPNKNNFRAALKINSQSHYMNVVGNVLGDTAYHTRYRCDNVDTGTTDNFVYDLGFWNSCEAGIDGGNPYDTVTQSSLMRWLNWDAVTYIANGNTNGIRSCTGVGVGNPACTASETASADPTFPGLASPAAILPASFYLNSQPAFWSVVGSTQPPWPPIGPDITGGNMTGFAGHAYKNPAQLCYENRMANGAIPFDAPQCYYAAQAQCP